MFKGCHDIYHPFLLVLEGANEKAAICHSKPRLGLSINICHMDVSAEDKPSHTRASQRQTRQVGRWKTEYQSL